VRPPRPTRALLVFLVCGASAACGRDALSIADGGLDGAAGRDSGGLARPEAGVAQDVPIDAVHLAPPDVAEGDALFLYLVGWTPGGGYINIPDREKPHLSELPKAFTVMIAVPLDPPSIVWELDGKQLPADNVPPFLMGEAPDGYPTSWNPGPGTFVVKATSFQGGDGRGAVIASATRVFTFLP
jgi:hypothetical protein